MRYERNTLTLLSALAAAMLARLHAATQPSPVRRPRPLPIPIETAGFQPIARGRTAMMPPVLPSGRC